MYSDASKILDLGKMQ